MVMSAWKEALKRRIPERWLYYVKTDAEIFRYLRAIRRIDPVADASSVFLLGTPLHENLGDHLIAYAELAFLRDAGFQRVTEIPYEIFQLYAEELRRRIPETALICVTGGGWMGNLWPVDERCIQRMLRTFRKNRIVIFPQTIYYDESLPDGDALCAGMRECCRLCSDLTICLRERVSYDFALKHYGGTGANILLAPDIALYLKGRIPGQKARKAGAGVALCLRKDREIVQGGASAGKIRRALSDNGIRCSTLSTLFPCRVPSRLRPYVLRRTWEAFGRPRLVITDRLHGMILSYLAGTPCVVMDNRTKKISGVWREWLSQEPYIKFCDSAGEAIRAALEWEPPETSPRRDFSFEELKEVVLWKKSNA